MRDSFSIQSFSATTSTSPVARLGFTGVGRALGHRAFHRDDILGAQHLAFCVHGLAGVGVKHNLRHPIAIPQVNEEDAAQIPPPVDPSHQQGALAGVRNAQLAATVRAAKIAQEIQL